MIFTVAENNGFISNLYGMWYLVSAVLIMILIILSILSLIKYLRK